MKNNRRNFLKIAALGCGAAAFSPFAAIATEKKSKISIPDYSALDKVLRLPVLRQELFSSPVIIEKIELLRDRKNFICRVTSKDGAVGLSVGHPNISHLSYPLFIEIIIPYFTGKDARNLDELIYKISQGNVKKQGVPFNVQLATLEFAILDMLGNIAGIPSGNLLGNIKNREISIYLGHFLNEFRKKEPEVSLDLMYHDVQETKAKAIKIRAGRGDNLASDIDNAPGRTEKLIRLAREKFGDDMVLMIDGNGSYSVKEAIRIGKILEQYKFYF